MNWKKFFKPLVSKIIIFAVLILIFGVPAYLKSCGSYIQAGTAQHCFGPSLVLFNGLTYASTTGVLDVSYNWTFNPFIIGGYLIVLYLLLSLIFHIAHYKWKRALLYTIGVLILMILARQIISVIGNRTFIG